MMRVPRRVVIGVALSTTAAVATTLPFAPPTEAAPDPIPVGGPAILIAGGPGRQTDPHLSGSTMTFTNQNTDLNESVSEIRYHDLESGATSAIPHDGHRDSLSDVDGNMILFRRIFTDGLVGTRAIMAFDTSEPSPTPVELAAELNVRRREPSVAGSTAVWMEQVAGSSSEAQTDIVASDLDTGVTTRITDDGLTRSNRAPSVSRGGSVISWESCVPIPFSCDVLLSHRQADGTWGEPVDVAASAAHEGMPTTNGDMIVYASDEAGDFDINWIAVDGSVTGELDMPGDQYRPAVSDTFISFESTASLSSPTDIVVYDLATGQLYQVTDTANVAEVLSDISSGPDGTVRVVWAQPDGLALGDNDVYGLSLPVTGPPAFGICPLYDQTRSHRVKSTVPIRLQVCTADGENVSSPELVVSAGSLTKLDDTASSAVVEDAGNANPDDNFRYDENLHGYVYNLATRNLSPGTWELRLTVIGDPTTHHVTLDLR